MGSVSHGRGCSGTCHPGGVGGMWRVHRLERKRGAIMIIVDLDGCIADDRWRRHMIRPASVPIRERFHKYHLAGCRDHLCNADLVYSDDHLVVVVTSRPEWYRRLTHQWLLDWEIMPRAIIMRRDDDYRPSVEVKRDAALRLIEEHGLNGIE